LDADTRGVPGVQRAVTVEVADVVRRVPGRREALQPGDAVADDVDVLLGNGRELAPQRVEDVTVEPARAPLEPLRIDEVRRADAGDVHLQAGVLSDEDPSRSGVVEVDVREEQVAKVAELDAPIPEACPESVHARRRPAVEERGAVRRVEQVGADDALGAEVVEVDRGPGQGPRS
jgi:hypothetical protein